MRGLLAIARRVTGLPGLRRDGGQPLRPLSPDALSRIESDIEARLAARRADRPDRSRAAEQGHRTRATKRVPDPVLPHRDRFIRSLCR